MGRFLQEQFGQEPQVIITMPLLEGLDGVHKMSKSLGNAVSLSEPADTAYAKLMSISDNLMWRYYHLLLRMDQSAITELKRAVTEGRAHPMVLKKNMALAIIRQFWSEPEAQHAAKQFEALFQRQDYSAAQEVAVMDTISNPIWIADLLKVLKVCDSSSQVKRLIDAGAVEINQQVITDFKAMIVCASGMIVKAGKHKIFKLQ